MCGAASVQSVVIRIPYISKWSLGTENVTSSEFPHRVTKVCAVP